MPVQGTSISPSGLRRFRRFMQQHRATRGTMPTTDQQQAFLQAEIEATLGRATKMGELEAERKERAKERALTTALRTRELKQTEKLGERNLGLLRKQMEAEEEAAKMKGITDIAKLGETFKEPIKAGFGKLTKGVKDLFATTPESTKLENVFGLAHEAGKPVSLGSAEFGPGGKINVLDASKITPEMFGKELAEVKQAISTPITGTAEQEQFLERKLEPLFKTVEQGGASPTAQKIGVGQAPDFFGAGGLGTEAMGAIGPVMGSFQLGSQTGQIAKGILSRRSSLFRENKVLSEGAGMGAGALAGFFAGAPGGPGGSAMGAALGAFGASPSEFQKGKLALSTTQELADMFGFSKYLGPFGEAGSLLENIF